MHNFKEGDTAVVAPEHKVFQFHDGEWHTPTSSKLNVSLMELNEMLTSSKPDFTQSQLAAFKKDIESFVDKKCYMLIQHDYHYVTLFLQDDEKESIGFYDILMECIDNIGPIKDYAVKDGYIEIWIHTKHQQGTKMYLLFPYEEGCVYYHG